MKKDKEGIIRSVDNLGRLVIPKELRKVLGIDNGEPVLIWVEGERVIVERYVDSCVLCGNTDKLSELTKNKKICQKCIDEITEIENLSKK